MCDYDIIFDIYKNSLQITYDVKIKHMPQLVGHFYNYLNSIINNNYIIKIDILKKNKDDLIKYINNIYLFISSFLSVDHIEYFNNYYLLSDLLVIAICILYNYSNINFTIKKKNIMLNIFLINNILKELNIDINDIDKDKKFKKRYISYLSYLFFNKKTLFKDNEKYKALNNIITNFYNIYKKKLNLININKYYTLPQYEGICWFTAFINSICYSDANKKLLLLLENNIKTENNLDEHSNISDDLSNINRFNYKQILIILVYKIINYIDNYNTENMLKYFKKLPILFFNKIHDIIKTTNSIKPLSNFFNSLKTTIISDKDIYGLSQYDNIVYVDLYNFLNIKSIFLIFYNKKLYITSPPIKSPDIILINTLTGFSNYLNTILNKTFNNFSYNNDIEIYYDGIIYELDYILYSSLFTFNSLLTGHVISSITFNNKEYFHDTNKIISTINNEFHISCPLVRKNWKDNFKYKNIKKFSLSKCYYFNKGSQISKELLKYTYANYMQYSMTDNNIACYVKKTTEQTSGGNNEKLKSTNTKINIIIDNKNIQRTVYINNNGIKVIKYNNKLIKIYNK